MKAGTSWSKREEKQLFLLSCLLIPVILSLSQSERESHSLTHSIPSSYLHLKSQPNFGSAGHWLTDFIFTSLPLFHSFPTESFPFHSRFILSLFLPLWIVFLPLTTNLHCSFFSFLLSPTCALNYVWTSDTRQQTHNKLYTTQQLDPQ